jgi:hypothetical protein
MINRSAVGGWQKIRMATLKIKLKIVHIFHYIIGHPFFSISKHSWHLEHIFSHQDFKNLFFRGLLIRLDNASFVTMTTSFYPIPHGLGALETSCGAVGCCQILLE